MGRGAAAVRVLVTGGGGFIGGALARALRAAGHEVRSFSRGEYAWMRDVGIEHFRGDLADGEAVARAAAGCVAVAHTAALAGVWGPRAAYERANIQGTAAVLEAARRAGIRSVVFTSSPSVTFDRRDQRGTSEAARYPSRWLAHYPRTKAEAERMVLAANGPELATVALRPHLVWGPGDRHLVPRLVERAREGKLRLVRAPGKRVDSTYIDNAVDAHLLALERLAPGATCAGRAYFISNGEPMPMEDLVGGILEAHGLERVRATVSPGVAWRAGSTLEVLWRLLRLGGEPPLTRFVAAQLATDHWFDLTAARRDLGYAPRVSIAEGLRRLAASAGQPPGT